MKRLSDMLGDHANSGVYLLKESSPVESVATITKERGLALFHIEGQDIRDKDQFLKQVATVLSFPEYFGNNWDAFADCLTDMSWHEADGFVILYDHFDPLAEYSPREFEMALEVFKESTESWRDRGKAFFVLLCGEESHGGDLPSVLL